MTILLLFYKYAIVPLTTRLKIIKEIKWNGKFWIVYKEIGIIGESNRVWIIINKEFERRIFHPLHIPRSRHFVSSGLIYRRVALKRDYIAVELLQRNWGNGWTTYSDLVRPFNVLTRVGGCSCNLLIRTGIIYIQCANRHLSTESLHRRKFMGGQLSQTSRLIGRCWKY